MRQKLGTPVSILSMLVTAFIPCSLMAGQAPDQAAAPPALQEQLQAQYKVVKMGSDSNGPTVIEEGTVLAIQKGGILGVPYANPKGCPAKYENANLKPPSGWCTQSRAGGGKLGGFLKNKIPGSSNVSDSKTSTGDTRYFKKGEKVYPSNIAIDLKNEKIAFGVVACDTCNKTDPPTYYKAEVDFQFPSGFLEKGDVSKIEDTIAEVFQLDSGGDAQQSQGQQQGGQDQQAPAGQGQDQAQAPAAAPAAAPPAAPAGPTLTNDDVLKLVKAKLPESVIIKKIANSNCAFDTDPDALIKLKQAGVSEGVINAMVDKK
jgi:hypothetical protein